MKRWSLIIFSLTPLASFAGFSVVKVPPPVTAPPASPAAAPSASAAIPSGTKAPSNGALGLVAVTYVGKAADPIEVRNGFGRDVPLGDALKQITPPGWHAAFKEELLGRYDGQKKVSWRGGRPWTDVLDILANEQGFGVEVDWDKKTLMLGNQYRAPVSVVAGTPKAKPAVVWSTDATQTLSSTLAMWAKKAGWSVKWGVNVDYAIPGNISYTGDFTDAVKSLGNIFKQVDQPLCIDGWNNSVYSVRLKPAGQSCDNTQGTRDDSLN